MADVGSLGTRLLRIVLGLCALVLVLLALYVSLGRQLVPLVAEYRQQLEDEAGKQLGIPVRIAELTGSWRGFEPLVVARDIQVGDGEQSLRLARGAAARTCSAACWRASADRQPGAGGTQADPARR